MSYLQKKNAFAFIIMQLCSTNISLCHEQSMLKNNNINSKLYFFTQTKSQYFKMHLHYQKKKKNHRN